MKLILGAISLVFFVGCAVNPTLKPYGKGHEFNINNVIKNANVNDDKFKKAAFITPTSRRGKIADNIPFSNRWHNLKPYLVIDKSKKREKQIKRLVFDLDKEGWLFMSSAHFMCNGKELKLSFPRREVQRDVVYGASISEVYDHMLSEKQFSFLSKCKTGDKYRIYGAKGYIEFSWKEEEVVYFKEVKLVSSFVKKKGFRGVASVVEKNIKQSLKESVK